MTYRSNQIPLSSMDGLAFRAHAGSPTMVFFTTTDPLVHPTKGVFQTKSEAVGWARLALYLQWS